MRQIQSRLNKLARQAQVLASRPLYINWSDRVVKYQLLGGRPTIAQFGTTYEAMQFIEEKAEIAESVIGLGYVSNVAELLGDGLGGEQEYMDVVINMASWDKRQELAWVILATWAKVYAPMQLAIEARIQKETERNYDRARNSESLEIEDQRQEPVLSPEQERERLRRVWNSGSIHSIG